MPDLSRSPSQAAVAARLRAAGCVFAEDEARLLMADAPSPRALDDMLRRRVGGEPLEQVLGWAEFRGVRYGVAPGVFVPRRRTEFLVEQALTVGRPGAVVLDMCCGTGALGLAVAAAAGDVELHAADIDPAAVRCARANIAARAPETGTVYEGDLFAPLPARLRGRVDLLLANVPYVPAASIEAMPAEARAHEHRVALDGGGDGLDVLRRLAAAAPGWLAPGGHLLTEVSERQVPVAAGVLGRAGLAARAAADADRDAHVIIGRRAVAGPA